MSDCLSFREFSFVRTNCITEVASARVVIRITSTTEFISSIIVVMLVINSGSC